MREAGVDVEDLAEQCQTTPDVVRAWLHGDTTPGKTQFQKIAARLRRPTAFFFLPTPPRELGIGAAFRSPAGLSGPRELLKSENDALRAARRIQRVARWIAERSGGQPVELPEVGEEDAERAADRVRAQIGWELERQVACASYRDAMRALRRHLEDRGLLVLHLRMSRKGCRGFSLYDDWAPVIAVNTATIAQARLFSYGHELGHLLRRTDRICGTRPDSRLERWCEAFSASFLLPRAPFIEFVHSRQAARPVSRVGEVSALSSHFNVSLRAVAHRLRDLELAEPGLYEEVLLRTEVTAGRGGGGERTPARRLSEWGRVYPGLLARAEERGLLARHDVLEYLDVSNTQFRDLQSLSAEDASDFED